MNTADTIPAPPPAVVPSAFSLANYRKFNDALEAKYGPTTRSRTAILHAQAREHLQRARKAGGHTALAVESLQAAVASMLDVLDNGEPAR